MNLILKYLLLIRLFAIGGQIVALLFMQRMFDIEIPLIPVVLTILGLSIFTIFSVYHYRDKTSFNDNVFVYQLLVDVLALSILVYFTGGSLNPFISLYVLPICFAAASLKPMYTSLIAITAMLAYTLLMFFHVPLENQHMHHGNFNFHLWGMWYGFLLSSSLLAYFIAHIAKHLRQQDNALAHARENALRTDRALALGTLAASTAHELGTPLSTMSILCKELKNDYNDEALQKDISILQEQIHRCKDALNEMSSDAGQIQADSGEAVSIKTFFKTIIHDWQNLYEDKEIQIDCLQEDEGKTIVADRALKNAIVNILNNAADACINLIHITADWNDKKAILDIKDDGEGLSSVQKNKMGKDFFSTKEEQGLGIGLFLSQTTLHRFGGSISFDNHDAGGAHVVITLPLESLEVK